MKRTTILWITVLVLGLLFDILFWKQAPGINFAIYAVACLGGAFLVLGMNGFKPSWKALLLLLPILFFAAMTFIRLEPLSMFLAYAFTLALMGMLAFSYLGGGWTSFGLADHLLNYLRLLGSMIARPLMFLAERRKAVPAESAAGTKDASRRLWAILRGVLIAIPILVVFAALLSSADLVFAQRVQEFTRLFRLEKLPEYLFRCIYILVGAYALAGTMLHAAQKSGTEQRAAGGKPLVKPFLGFTEAVVVLGAVVALFACFVVIQFQYFFGGQTNIGVEGYTYSEYARRGFGELVAVACFSLLLLLALSAVTKRQDALQRRVFSGLGLGMVALTGVMLYSAFQRLLLYEAAYGFSRLRMYTHVFMIWLGVLLLAVMVLEVLRRETAFALAFLLVATGFAASLTLVNVDRFIVQQNVRRAMQGQPLDVAYLASLSSDAVPALVTTLQDATLPLKTREAAGAALACYLGAFPAAGAGGLAVLHLQRLAGRAGARAGGGHPG